MSAFVAAVACAYAFCNLAVFLVVCDPLPPSLDAVFTFAGETQRISIQSSCSNNIRVRNGS